MNPATYNIENFSPRVRIFPNTKFGKLSEYVLLDDIVILTKLGRYEFALGFKFDGATVPWAARRVCPPVGMYLAATLIHDQACNTANESGLYKYRKAGDDLFYSHLRECGVSKWRAKPMAAAVKAYGKYLHRSKKLK